jgi:pimeloyl-ACP methyl ester carboxylesterase
MALQKFVSGEFTGGLPYIRLGQGSATLVIFPGISDAFRSIASMPRFAVWLYGGYARHFKVYVISRRRGLPSGYSIKEMARDYALAIEEIGGPVHVLGLSMGSFIAQYLATDFPGRVKRLVLSLGSSRSIPQTVERARRWIELVQTENWDELYAESVDVTFSGLHRIFWRRLTPLLMGRPEIPNDFVITLEACIHHDARERLKEITAPTLVLGGKKDVLVPEPYFRELAELIPGAELKLLEDGGHGVFEQRKREFDSAVINFLRESKT